MVECYESLRQELGEPRNHAVCGRAILMRNGMAAWMGSILDRAPDTQAATLISDARLSAGIEQNLINIVASMTLTTVGENMP